MLKLHFAFALFFFAAFAQAQQQPKTDADFPFQGEYVGQVRQAEKIGAQVIALGDGKFRAVFYHPGLPGDGWTKDKPKFKTDGARENDTVTFAGGTVNGVIKNGEFKVNDADNNSLTL